MIIETANAIKIFKPLEFQFNHESIPVTFLKSRF